MDTLAEKVAFLKANKSLLQSPGPKGIKLRAVLKEVEGQWKEIEEEARQEEPLAFFKPSYEQALLLNAWMYGISFLCVYSANRIGKTTACFINFLLWVIPNNPAWQIFKPYTDHLGRKVQVFPRPDIAALKLISDRLPARLQSLSVPPNPRLPHYQAPAPTPARSNPNPAILQWLQKEVPFAFSPTYPLAPWNRNGVAWFGAPDQDHHEQVIMPLFKEYIPRRFLRRYVTSDREMTLEITAPTGRTTQWELIGKSYESKDTKWSSGAVDAILLTEGVKADTLREIKLRFKDPGIGSHDFTPYLPANGGQASYVAQRIATGKDPLPLRYHVFTRFTVYDAPSHIISDDKKKGLIESLANDPEAAARLSGEFYSNSALILSKLSRETHLLSLSRKELFRRYPTARLYRGLDPGLDHPCACAWGALLPNNVWVIYRIMSERGLSLSDRVRRIVELSNNRLSKVWFGRRSAASHGASQSGSRRFSSGPPANATQNYYMQEVHTSPLSEVIVATPTDYHTFKTDEVTGTQFALNYTTRGLAICESVHTGPEDRAQQLDDLLAPDQFTPHLLTNRPPGPRVYFLKNEPGIMQAFLLWEELYWDRKKSGPNKGLPNDKVPEHGDNELDAVCYLTSSPFRWTKNAPRARLPDDSEPEEHMIEAAITANARARSLVYSESAMRSPNLQSLQNSQPQEIVHFGGDPYEALNNDSDNEMLP